MPSSWDLLQFVEEIFPDIIEIKGFLYFRRFGESQDQITEKILSHASPEEAQLYINTVTISDQIRNLGVDWKDDLDSTKRMMDIIVDGIGGICAGKLGKSLNGNITYFLDEDDGEIYFNLVQARG